MKNKTKVALIALAGFLVFSGFQGKSAENDLIRAKATLQQIFSLYNSGHHHLLNETYPYKQDNMDQLWNHIRDRNGLFSKDWKGQKDDPYKWLLDQASLVEIWGTLAEMK